MKLAFISNHPAPYRDPFLNRLVKSQHFQADVYSLFPRDSGHSFWNLTKPEYDQVVIVPKPCSKVKTFLFLIRKFVFGKYECTIWPGFLLWYLTACMLMLALLGKKYGFTADTVSQLPISKFAFAIKRFIIKRAALIFVPGAASREYFVRTFGVDSKKVCLGGYALDNDLLAERFLTLRKNRAALRTQYGLAEKDRVFLMVANMIPTRHYPITTAGFLKAAANYPDARFVIVGRGPDLERMLVLGKENPALKVYDGVSFDEMLNLYAIADVYVHGGTEPASTALVIGAIAGLPLLSSEAVGCSKDCLLDGETGVKVTNYLDIECWANGFNRLLSSVDHWLSFGASARKKAALLDVKTTLAQFESIVCGLEVQS